MLVSGGASSTSSLPASLLLSSFSPASWLLSSWLASLPPSFSWQAFWPLSFSRRACCHRLLRRERRAWVREVAERTLPVHSLLAPAGQLLPPPLLPLRNPLRATRCRRRCRRILLLHHVRRVWGRRTSLLLLILSGFRAQERLRRAAGYGKLKDHQNLCWNGGRL